MGTVACERVLFRERKNVPEKKKKTRRGDEFVCDDGTVEQFEENGRLGIRNVTVEQRCNLSEFVSPPFFLT